MRTRMALLLGGSVALGLSLRALAPAEEIRIAQAAGPVSAEVVARGRELFNDLGLSADRKWSCACCHPNEGHTDNKTCVGVTVVADEEPTGRSTPTLWGAGFRRAYSWAGTDPSLEANVSGIIVNCMTGRRAVARDPLGPVRLCALAGVSPESEFEGGRLALRRGPGGGQARIRALPW
jgi:di-heme cytochrome c peroxidase